MAERNIMNVLYKLRGDTLSNWSTKNPVLAEREPAIVMIPADSGSGLNEPAVLLKIGDGTTAFNDLGYLSAIAGDVPAWAKAAEKPAYTADEIDGLAAYISGKIQDTDTHLNLAGTYETKGAAAAVKTELIGSDTDTADSNTIAGAKKYADEVAAEKANEKVAFVGATDNSIEIGGTATAPTIGVKVSPDADNVLQKTDSGMKVVIPDAAEISVVKKATANDGYIATYQVTVDGNVVGTDINIPKDYLVKSANIKVVTTADDPYTGAAVGDKYIDFVVNVVSGDGNETHIYLSVQDLVDEYIAGDGIDISDSNIVQLKIDTTNANGLSVDAAGLKMGIATDAAAGAMSAADHTKLSNISAGATKIEHSETNGNVKINGAETTVYTLPASVLDAGDTFIFDGGNA